MTRLHASRQRLQGLFFAGPRPRLLAHRGFALEHDENTLEAFAAAITAGTQILETDVQATRDGIAVLFHDDALPSGKQICDLTARQVSTELLPRGGRVPTLREALSAFSTARFNIDIKSAAAIADAAQAIKDSQAIDRVLVTSFSGQRRREIVRLLPGVATSASATMVVAAVIAGTLGWTVLMRWVLRTVDAVQIPERVLGLSTVTPRMVRRFHEAGVEMHVWTINEESAVKRLLFDGVDGIVTDRCDIAKRVFAL